MKKVPEFFYTTIRKVEPVSGNCVRLYYSVERNGTWEDQVTLVVPIAQLATNAKFVSQSATEIFNEGLSPVPAVKFHTH